VNGWPGVANKNDIVEYDASMDPVPHCHLVSLWLYYGEINPEEA
jgi:hypothetical protein